MYMFFFLRLSLFLLFVALFFSSIASEFFLSPPIRITPKPNLALSENPHGPFAQPEPADGFAFIGIGEETRETNGVGRSPKRKAQFGHCTFKYIPSSCKQTKQCDSQRLCVQITGDPCCAPGEGECPTPTQLDVSCLKHKPINWCHHGKDCAKSALCCDTGCGYNMCVERHQI